MVSYVIPASMSFPSAQDGWAVGDGCDPRNACEAVVARTTDGGVDWALVSPPVDPRQPSNGLQLLAASGLDAWVWGTDADGAAVFTASHDGGQTWQPIGTGSMVVSDLALDGGTVWAVEGCPASGGACADHVLSSPVTGGAWTDLGPMPLTAQVAPVTSVFSAGPVLTRAGRSAWVLTTSWYPTSPALVRSDEGGATWTTLGLPCQATMSPLALAAASPDDLMMVCGIPGVWPAPQEIWASDDGGVTWPLRSREG